MGGTGGAAVVLRWLQFAGIAVVHCSASCFQWLIQLCSRVWELRGSSVIPVSVLSHPGTSGPTRVCSRSRSFVGQEEGNGERGLSTLPHTIPSRCGAAWGVLPSCVLGAQCEGLQLCQHPTRAPLQPVLLENIIYFFFHSFSKYGGKRSASLIPPVPEGTQILLHEDEKGRW